VKRSRAISLAVASCAALAACSSSAPSTAKQTSASTPSPAKAASAAQYKSLLKTIAAEENLAQHAVQKAFHASSVTAIRQDLLSFATDQQHVTTELSAISPPADARAANTALAQAFSDNANATRRVAAELASAPNAKAALHIIATAKSAQRSGQEIDTALHKLQQLGYTHGS